MKILECMKSHRGLSIIPVDGARATDGLIFNSKDFRCGVAARALSFGLTVNVKASNLVSFDATLVLT